MSEGPVTRATATKDKATPTFQARSVIDVNSSVTCHPRDTDDLSPQVYARAIKDSRFGPLAMGEAGEGPNGY